ncbi:unnamed protein product [Pieris brassicae]|uniref:Uncharacterized protein n=1 Tax=Pieris brassicae TaxID=7116 RepID=A0A9P0X8E6_PIEBR|nr:unnamed protein product [Pieris brassicae]
MNTIPCKLNIVQVYAPTSLSTEEEVENFYETLSKTMKECLRRVAGRFGIGERNDRGERFVCQLLVATVQVRFKRICKSKQVPNMQRLNPDGFRQGIAHRMGEFQSEERESNSKWEWKI